MFCCLLANDKSKFIMQASNVENLLIEIDSFVGKILTKTIYVMIKYRGNLFSC